MALRHLPPFYLYTFSTLKVGKKYTYSIFCSEIVPASSAGFEK